MELGFSKIDLNDEPTAREKVYFVIVIVLITVAMMRLFWLPGIDGIKKKKVEVNNVKLQISTLRKFIEIDRKIPSSRPAGDKIGNNRPLEAALAQMGEDPKKVMADVVRDITSRRFMGSIVLNNLSFESAIAKSGYTEVPITLSVLGTFSALQSYLTMLEKLDYLITVDNVVFRLSEDHPGLVVADLNASIYVGGSVEGLEGGNDKKVEGGGG